LAFLAETWDASDKFSYSKGNNILDICITGVGIAASTYTLTKAFQKNYDLAIQAGIAGSFDKAIKLGTLVFINSEQFGDLGAEDHYKFIDIFELGLLETSNIPYTEKELITPVQDIHRKIDLQKVKGITVNTVAGSAFTIRSRMEAYAAQVESMEGAAFHYVCLKEKIPFAQIRCISNYIEPRDKSKWQIKEAVINLNKWLIDFIESL